jgi:sialic acid synthase SpsE
MDIIEKISNSNNYPLIVAELSGNHGGDINKAFLLIESCREIWS